MRIVVIGATSAIAEHCCRLWVAREACDLVLVARDAAKAGRVADDLRVRSPASTIGVIETDFLDVAAIGRLAGETAAQPIDIVLIAHGVLPEQSLCENDLVVCRDTLEVNAVSPALFAEAFAGHFAKAGRGTIALIGSVAGDRGRKANYTYGACKGLVARYAEGLEHRFAGTGVRVVLIKPGPTDTPMAAQHRASGRRLASVGEVARAIVRGIDGKRPVVYAPARWALIMFVVRHLPRFIFNRLNL
jgi:short-subunit dehydrogenase